MTTRCRRALLTEIIFLEIDPSIYRSIDRLNHYEFFENFFIDNYLFAFAFVPHKKFAFLKGGEKLQFVENRKKRN